MEKLKEGAGMTQIKAKHTSIIVPNYTLGSNEKIERMLSVYNEVYFRWEPIGFMYNEDTRELYLPRGLDLGYIENEFHMNVSVDSKHIPFETSSFRLKVEPRNNIQRKSISYLLGNGEFSYTAKHSQLALTLSTGVGKTYVVIAALSFLKMKSLIITHSESIKSQWKAAFLKNTDIDEKFIFNIDGSNTIKKIMKLNKLPYKVYLVNHRTLYSYAKKNGWSAVGELFEKLKIGVKVFDEAHLEFDNLMKIDLNTNVKKTFYLTATFERSQFKENSVFNLAFKNIVKYGEETRKELRKYIIYIPLLFDSNPSMVERASIRGRRGWFDKNKYNDYLIQKEIFFDVLKYLINFFSETEGKKLIMTSKIDSTKVVRDFLSETYPNFSVGLYNSQITDDDKIKALDADIISSTPKSLGTGNDIPALRVVVNFEPYSSNISANQYSGRLREYNSTDYTFFIEPVDTGFPDIVRMYKKRLGNFKKKCAKIVTVKYNKDNG